MKDVARTVAQRVADIAATFVGLREKGGANCGPPIERFAGGRCEAWCAHFVATLYRDVGRPLPGDIMPSPTQHNPIARCAVMWANLCEIGWTMPPMVHPQEGDLFFFSHRASSDPGPGWHVGIVTAVQGPWLQGISGNWGDAVARHRIDPGDRRLVGFARVPG